MAYTPGVGRVSMAFVENPQDVSRLRLGTHPMTRDAAPDSVLGLPLG